MKILNRKGGDHKSILFTMLTLVLVILLLGVTMNTFAQHGSEATQDMICRASVIARGKATISLAKGVVEMEKITPIACNTKNLGELRGDREEVKKQIADYSSKCWWNFAEGSVVDVFKADKGEKDCFVCYTFTVDDKLDKGTTSGMKVFAEVPIDKRNSTITGYEMTNYLVSESYNPGVIYGGGTKSYFGQTYDYKIPTEFSEPRTIKLGKIRSTLVTGYVMDYSHTLSTASVDKINQVGVKLAQKGAGTMFVVVADEFDSMENDDARKLIENLKLNTNDTSYDAILILLDLKNHKMRMHLGIDQSIFVQEYDLTDIMEDQFEDAQSTCRENADCIIETALTASIEEVAEKIINEQNKLQGISPKSYYYYLTNAGEYWTIIKDIAPQDTYVIAYLGSSDEIGFWRSTFVGKWIRTTSGAGPIELARDGITGEEIARYFTEKSTNEISNVLIAPVNDVADYCASVRG